MTVLGNNTCSGGQSIATAAKWAQVALDMYPGYNGTRPKMQIWVCEMFEDFRLHLLISS